MDMRVNFPFLFFFFVYVRCAIIPVKENARGKIQALDERVYLGDTSNIHNTFSAPPTNKRLCEECKHTDLCRLEGDCTLCAQYCKSEETDGNRHIQSSQENIENGRELEDGMAGDSAVSLTGGIPEEEVVQMIRSTDDEALNERSFEEDALGQPNKETTVKSDQESVNAMESRESDGRGDKTFHRRRHEARYYVVGMIEHSPSLRKLLKLTSVGKDDEVEKAVILVKSRTPIFFERGILDDIGDSAFFKKITKELEMAEEDRGMEKLSIKDINRIIENTYEKFDLETKHHIVGLEETSIDENKNETVGCSKEETEIVPFTPFQPNIYRSESSHNSKRHPGIIVQPEDLDDSQESFSEKHSKNPVVIEGNPDIHSRRASHTSENAHEIIDSISEELKQLEDMKVVGLEQNNANPEEPTMTQEQDDFEDETSVDDRTRTHKLKLKKKYKKGHSPSYSYHDGSPSYGYHSQGGIYRHSDIGEHHKLGKLENLRENNSEEQFDIVGVSDGQSGPNGEIKIPHTNIKLDKNNFLHARPDLDAHDGIPQAFHEGIHSHFRKIQDFNKKNMNNGRKEHSGEIDAQHSGPQLQNTKETLEAIHTMNRNVGSHEDLFDETAEVVSNETHDKKGDSMVASETSGLEKLHANEDGISDDQVHLQIDSRRLDDHETTKHDLEIVRSSINDDVPSTDLVEEKNVPGMNHESHHHTSNPHMNHKINAEAKLRSSEADQTEILQETNVPMLENYVESESMLGQQKSDVNDKTKLKDDIDKSLPGKTVIQIDDQLIDIPKEGPSIFRKGDQVGSAIDIQTNLDENNLENSPTRETVGSVNIESQQKKGNFEQMSGQLKEESTMVPVSFPTKIEQPIFKPGMISSAAPAFVENRRVEIEIPTMSQNQETNNLEMFSVTEKILKMSGMNVNENSDSIIGNQLIDKNDVTPEDIDKLITPRERDFLHNFGKIVPAAEKMHLNISTDVYFMGNGIKLPLKVSQNTDGSLALSVDFGKLCKCKNETCAHKREMMKQFDQSMVGVTNHEFPRTEERSENIISSENVEDRHEEKTRRARHHLGYARLRRNHRKQYHKLHKRSVINTSVMNDTTNRNQEQTGSDISNSLLKDFDPADAGSFNDIKELHRFKQVESQLEQKLEKLHEDVNKSSKEYGSMLKKGTQDLLQIKDEDQVVKQRIELVNDLLKWMKDMAENMTILENTEKPSQKTNHA